MEYTVVEKRRRECGREKGWLAKKVGVARGTMTLILKGSSTPTLPVAIRIARILETTVEELWGHLVEEESRE
ncbi:helix-turn-helix domain-containing protein [Salibacterium salarium]|uniref:Helix-turn-helix domain-containing protein n=1 Tax=Salibacterium salarium TaxID=284579 RepID=A0A3R9PKC2_9BACI|nr:helix-turn-helix domain-containing protein [Salibacterium salarium]RSL32681.1 helix-turn-helix domain-containing protein [Salibacterium salarium]